MDEDKILDGKLELVFGRRYQIHHTHLSMNPPPVFVFQIPGTRGFFGIDKALDKSTRHTMLDVYSNGAYLGRMDYNTRLLKFGSKY